MALSIAMVGLRGVPATYGGIERHVEELGSRLAARGHQVTVYCRSAYLPAGDCGEDYRGMHRRVLGGAGSKHLEALSHTALSTWDLMRERFDVVHFHAVGPGALAPVPRLLSGRRVVLTVHGLDFDREKWGAGARAALKASAWVSAHAPHRTIVVAKSLQEAFRDRYGVETDFIPNGVASQPPLPAREITERFGLAGGSYALFVGRLVPEKAPHLLIEAADVLAARGLKLVVVGGSSNSEGYSERLRAEAERRGVVMAGYVYGDALRELYSNARVFVQPSSLEGMPLTLLEAASYGVPLVASDIPVHREMLGKDQPGGRIFRSGDVGALRAALGRSLEADAVERPCAASLGDRLLSTYSWEATADATEESYRAAMAGAARGGLRSAAVPSPSSLIDLTAARPQPDVVDVRQSEQLARPA